MNRKKTISTLFSHCMMICMFWMALSCSVDDVQETPNRSYSLSWSDEFDGAEGSLPNSDNWVFDLGNGVNGWGNQELQIYTMDTENVSLDGNGNLRITALRGAGGFTSARIHTKGLFAQRYGRFEARIKTPYGPGMWPAFWLLGDNIDEVGWPQCGEIDVMELRGQQPHIIHGSVHGPGYSAGNAITDSYYIQNTRFDKDFHIFAIEWGEDYIEYYVDDFLYQRISPEDLTGEWVFDRPFYILMNVAVGGTFVGFPTEGTPFPQTMYVDYVRAYTLSR